MRGAQSAHEMYGLNRQTTESQERSAAGHGANRAGDRPARRHRLLLATQGIVPVDVRYDFPDLLPGAILLPPLVMILQYLRRRIAVRSQPPHGTGPLEVKNPVDDRSK